MAHQSQIEHNTRVKIYPDGTKDIMVCTRSCFREQGWEAADREPFRAKALPPDTQASEPEAVLDEYSNTCSNTKRAQRRARAAVREIALCNPFSYFVTLTLDKEKIDRYDMKVITRKLNDWLGNRVRRNGLAYVLVPERHQDGAIHFHGFFNNALKVVESGHFDKNGHVIYNLPAWDFGFTTAIELYGDYHSAVGYVCKYIGKQGEKPGGRWYYSGGALAKPEVHLLDTDWDDFVPEGTHCFEVPETGARFAMWTERPAQPEAPDTI